MSNPTDLMNAILSGADVQTEAAASESAPAENVDDGEQSTNDPSMEVDHTSILNDWEKSGDTEGDKKEEPVEKKAADTASEDDKSKTSDDDSELDEESASEYIKAGGKRIKVDYADKAKIKKAYAMAEGMRKFQRERDDAIKRDQQKDERLTKLEDLWSKIETAADNGDNNTLMKIMTKGKTDFDTLLASKVERMKLRDDATEEEIEKMDLHDEVAKLRADLAKATADMSEQSASAKLDKEEASTKSMEAKITPAFDRYRFHGKLGDSDAEQQLDEMLWAKVLNNLEDYTNPSVEEITKEFRKSAAVLNKVITKQTDKQVKKTAKARKRNAKETAQLEHVRGYVDSNIKQEAASSIKSGDLTNVLKNWGKFGKLFELTLLA